VHATVCPSSKSEIIFSFVLTVCLLSLSHIYRYVHRASGASKLAYWLGSFMFDIVLLFTIILMVSIVLVCFRSSIYMGAGFGYVFGSGMLFAIASIFRFYIASFFISDVKMAQSIFFYGSLFLMYCFLEIWFITLFVGTAQGNASDSSVVVLSGVLTVLEPCFGWMMVILYQNNFVGIKTQNGGKSFTGSIAAAEFYGLLIACALYGLIFVLFMEGGFYELLRSACCCLLPAGSRRRDGVVTIPALRDSLVGQSADDVIAAPDLVVDSRSTGMPVVRSALPLARTPGAQDPDVVQERFKVQDIVRSGSINTASSAIFTHNLRKVYYARGNVPSKVAVKDISLSIGPGEVFGLLGANGAGKTTLLKIVSGLEQPTSGFALINGFDVVKDTSRAQRSMGLCPQFDTLIERLSVKENLLFFGQIKGLSGVKLVEVVEAFMAAMNIQRYQNKLIMQLSGGNRRKVSLAVALLGAPPTVYLDEPSTGLDPVASRLMWRLLSKIAEARSTAIVLTTHNMLECEAVCTRICIMKLGEMVCLGDSQHLRSAHGTGFLLEVSLQDETRAEAAKNFVEREFRGAIVVDEHAAMVNFEIPRQSISKLSNAFRLMEEQKASLGVVDYSLSQSTLEQVLLRTVENCY
jgi:ABC-type multidrug transport system ATPase subunit